MPRSGSGSRRRCTKSWRWRSGPGATSAARRGCNGVKTRTLTGPTGPLALTLPRATLGTPGGHGPSTRDGFKEHLMADTAAGVLIDTIHDWGVDVIFGLPGDGINGIMEALRIRHDKIRFVQVRHEESAALMACGYAKFTGKLGVCLATSGPGGIHLLNGLYDAALDGQPVLAITGMAYHDLIGTHTQQDVALDRLFMDVAKFNERIMGPS